MFWIYLIALLLYIVAISIGRNLAKYDQDAYVNNKWGSKQLKEDAGLTKMKYPIIIWILFILSFFLPVFNIIIGIIVICVELVAIFNDDWDVEYLPGKIVKFLSKKF